MATATYAKSRFIVLQTPVWAGLSAESRLSDVRTEVLLLRRKDVHRSRRGVEVVVEQPGQRLAPAGRVVEGVRPVNNSKASAA